MDSPKSESLRIKWSSDSHDTHLRSPFHDRQRQLTNTSSPHHEKKEIETEDNKAPPKIIMNDENQDTNAPFHLSHHHLIEQNATIANQNKKTEISPTRPNFSSPQNIQTSSSSNSSSNHIISPQGYRHMMHTSSQPQRFRIPHSHKYSRHHPSHARSTAHDNLQRRLQKLEQDILSRNIQHDIMVNKEEMMGKRLKTKDIRINNLQKDINKLRDQLTAKNEAQDKLINEMSELQQQNMGLSTKLRESNIGLNVSDTEDTNHYNESMRDILNHIQQKLYQLTTDIHEIKQNEAPPPDLTNTIQSCIAPMVQQMKEQQRENMADLTSQMQKYEGVLDKKYNAFERENNMSVVMHKLNEMNQNTMESTKHSKQLERYLEQNTKAMTENQQRLMNALKEDIKREMYSTKSELNAQIQTIKTENHTNIKQFTHDLKYEIKSASVVKKEDESKDAAHHKVNANVMTNECKELIQANGSKLESIKQDNTRVMECVKQDMASCVRKMRQILDENATKTNATIRGLEPLFERITNYHKSTDGNVIQCINQNNDDLIQSFAQFKHDFQKIIESVLSQTPSIASSPLQSQSQPLKPMDSSSVLKEMKRMNTYLNDMKSSERSEFNSISTNIQQMARRHDEIVKIITNTLPTTMDKAKKDNAKLSQMYTNLTQAIEQMKTMQMSQQNTAHKAAAAVHVSPSKHVYNGNHDESVKLMKSLIMSQIEETKKSFSKMDSNMTLKLDRLLQEINSRNVSLFNNIKQINDKQQQHIIHESDSNRKKAIKSHESVLKSHLQQIQLRLNELNTTQHTMHKSSLNLKESIDNALNEKMESVVNELRGMMTMKEVKDVMNYIRNDVMKEVQLIKNLCNDMHKKSQQLPHFVARNKDLKIIQQSLNELSTVIPSKVVQTMPKPAPLVTKVNEIGPRRNGMAANQVMSVLMMPFKIWCENILSQISNHRDDCSIFVIIYVLSQIAFATFAYKLVDDIEDDGAEQKHEEDGEVERLSRMQSRALSILDDIEKAKEEETEDGVEVLNKEMIIQTVIEWMQRILSENMEDVWISRTGQEMAHLCHVQFRMNDALNTIKEKMNQMMKKQSKTCLNMTLFQPLLLCGSTVLIVGFCLWFQSIQSQQNHYF